MPSVYEFLQNPELFVHESTLSENPDILNSMIDYISTSPNPLLHNDQECYVYPNKSAEILSLGTTYRVMIVKRERKNKTTGEMDNFYPYLDRLFRNLEAHPNLEQNLLGYTNRVLISFAKKTPQIYEYIKDNQDIIAFMVKNNSMIINLKQFWLTFIVESTMGLYVFLKNAVIRALMFRIIDESNPDNLVIYQTLYCIYLEMNSKLKAKILPEDEKEEIDEICANFHDEDFVTLLILKVSSKKSNQAYFIGKILNELQSNPQSNFSTHFSLNHMEALQDYFESYEDSSGFMDFLLVDQIQILKLLLNLSRQNLLQSEHEANLLKRVLVYTSIHKKNTVLHNILYNLIEIIVDAGRDEIFNEINVMPFLIKNYENEGCKYAMGSLVRKVAEYWYKNRKSLYKFVSEDNKKFIQGIVEQRAKKLQNSTFFSALQNISQVNPSQVTEKEIDFQLDPKESEEQNKEPQTFVEIEQQKTEQN